MRPDRGRDAVLSGSHVVLSHATAGIAPEAAVGVQRAHRAQGVARLA